MTIAALRGMQFPLSVWVEVAGLFALPTELRDVTGSLASQLYHQLLADFNPERRAQVEELLEEVRKDQALLTQLTVESMDLFNALAVDRDSVAYGSVVTQARAPDLDTTLEIGFDFIDQAQQALYYSLSRLSVGYDFPLPGAPFRKALRKRFKQLPTADASDGIVPTLSQPWGECIAAAQADHLDIIGHYGGSTDDSFKHYDWLTTRSEFQTAQFEDVWRKVVAFMVQAEGARS